MNFKIWLLKLHRWVTLVFALPLAALLLSGLVLSFEPVMTVSSSKTGVLSAEKLLGFLDRHDPGAKAASLTHRPYAGTLTIGMPGDDDDVVLATASGSELTDESWLAETFGTARRLHETLLLDLRWLVTASTWAMLALIPLGLLMGWPRFRNSLGGWHRGGAWLALPLVIISPLTGLALAYGLTFSAPAAAPRAAVPKLREAVQLVAASHDLSGLLSLRMRGPRLIARVLDQGEYRSFIVTADGLAPASRNWPRLIHEGNWGGHVSAWLNLLTAVVMLGLMGTGLTIWARRKFFRKRRQLQ